MYFTKEEELEARRIAQQRYRDTLKGKTPESMLLYRAKENAKKRNLEFDLDIEDIVVPTHCPLLNYELNHDVMSAYNPTKASIDRIDSSKGYVKGNVQVLCHRANVMKADATPEELVMFAKNVLALFPGV